MSDANFSKKIQPFGFPGDSGLPCQIWEEYVKRFYF